MAVVEAWSAPPALALAVAGISAFSLQTHVLSAVLAFLEVYLASNPMALS
jgi:hypothetical protein